MTPPLMRAKLDATSCKNLFELLAIKGHTIASLAVTIGVHERTISDWRRGKFSIPSDAFQKLVAASGASESELNVIHIDDRKRKSSAGKQGGNTYLRRYGPPGSRDSRVKGGTNSYIARASVTTDIFARKVILRPKMSPYLAEFIGIMIGDGSITPYQAIVSLNTTTDKEYIVYVNALIKRLFGLESTLRPKLPADCTNIVVSSRDIVEFLLSLGLPLGDKVRAGIDIPEAFKKDPDLLAACLRGIFDTDGGIFLEKHMRPQGVYAYPRMAFVSASPRLRQSIYDGLTSLDIRSKERQHRSVNIERFTDIKKYFRIVGSSNPKHLERYTLFGGVG